MIDRFRSALCFFGAAIKKSRVFFVVTGIVSAIWFILRTGRKPYRLAYPCQQVALNNTVLLLSYVLGLFGFKVTKKWFAKHIRVMYATTIIFLVLMGVGTVQLGLAIKTALPARADAHSHDPIGTGISKVVWVKDTDASTAITDYQNWRTGQTNGLSQAAIDTMVNNGVYALTGQTTAANAWSSLLGIPSSSITGKKFAIKVNFNNPETYFNSPPHTIVSLIKQLKAAGVNESDIYIYDISKPIWNSFRTYITTTSSLPSVNFVDRNNVDTYGWSGTYAFTTDHTGAGCRASFTADKPALLSSTVDYIINVPIYRGHGGAGVSLSFKNHYGSVPYTAPYTAGAHGGGPELHDGSNRTGTGSISACYAWDDTLPDTANTTASHHPLVQLNNDTTIRNKTKLVIGDGIFTDYDNNYVEAPEANTNSLFFATDPVAADSVMFDFLKQARGGDSGTLNSTWQYYLHNAAANTMGVHQHAASWSSGTPTYSSGSNSINFVSCPDSSCPAANPTLSVTKSGSGTITSNVGGLSCGSTCSASYAAGSSVVLTATAADGSSFSGWSGGGCSGTGTCTVTVNASTVVSATFTASTQTITASVTSTNGVISPSGATTVNYGASQTYTITPNTGYEVSGVVVDGSPVGAVTTYTFSNVSADHTIAASFSAIASTQLLTTSLGTGTITVSAAGAFEVTFSAAKGGSISTWYDLENDASKTRNLVYANGSLFNFGLVSGVYSYLAATTVTNSNLQLVEASSSRVVIKTTGLLGAQANWDYDMVYVIYPTGLIHTYMTITNASTNRAYTALRPRFDFSRNWTMIADNDDSPTDNEAFVSTQNWFGAYGANEGAALLVEHDFNLQNMFHKYTSTNQYELGMDDTDAATWNAGTTKSWNFSIYLRPDTLDDEATNDAYAADELSADSLTDGLTTGTAWVDSTEYTAEGDFFNEKEGVYMLETTTNNATFQLDGGTNNHFNPRFKIRGWSSTTMPNVVTVGGTTQTVGTNYNVTLKNISEAWYDNGGTEAQIADGGYLSSASEYLAKAAANYTPTDLTDDDYLYLGAETKFTGLNYLLATAGAGGAITWEYWNGSAWTSLSGVAGNSNLDTTTGSMSFTQPNNWAVKALASGTEGITGVRELYWIRANVATTFTTTPVIDRIWTNILLFQYLSNVTADDTAIVISLDQTAPTVTVGPSAATANTTATITWTTNEASSSQVQYGLSTSYGTTTTEADTVTRVTSHSVALSSLVACSKYHYRVISKDQSSNTLTGSDGTFTTTGCAGSAAVTAETDSTVDIYNGGTVSLTNGGETLSLTVPSNFSSSDANFQMKKLNKTTVAATTSTPTGKTWVGNHAYDLRALSAVSTAISSFDSAITVSATYDHSDITGLDESGLKLYRWDGSNWNQLSGCSVDTSANTVSCTTTAFSTFGLFGSEPAASPTPTPAASTSPTSSSSNSSSSTSNTASAPECHEEKPSSAPWLFAATSNASGEVTLSFTKAGGSVSSYSIEYGEQSGSYQHSALSIGNKDTTSYTISHLQQNKTYYFRVRGGNGCATGEWSNEISTKTRGMFGSSRLEMRAMVVDDQELEVEETPVQENRQTYTVQSGDTLIKIAKSQCGSSSFVQKLIADNKEQYPSIEKTIRQGWELTIDCAEEKTEEKSVEQISEEKKEETFSKLIVHLFDENKQPLVGAKVTIHSEPKTGTTNETGEVVFEKVEPGQHRFIVEYQNQESEQAITVPEGKEVVEMQVSVTMKPQTWKFIAVAIVALGIGFVGALLLFKKKNNS